MSFITDFLKLLNWNVRRRMLFGERYDVEVNEVTGMDSDQEDIDRPAFGNAYLSLTEHAVEHGQKPYYGQSAIEAQLLEDMRDSPRSSRIEVYPTVFGDGIVFSNGETGGWIIATEQGYIDMEEL